MPHFDPQTMSSSDQHRVLEWLRLNGLRHVIAYEPIVLRGNVVEYTALCRAGAYAHRGGAFADRRSLDRQTRLPDLVPLGRRRLRIRRGSPMLGRHA